MSPLQSIWERYGMSGPPDPADEPPPAIVLPIGSANWSREQIRTWVKAYREKGMTQ